MLIRIASGLIGTLSIFAVYFSLGVPALLWMSIFITVVAAFEFQLLFHNLSFWSVIAVVFSTTVTLIQIFSPEYAVAALCFSFVLLSTLCISIFRGERPEFLYSRLFGPLVGVLYMGLLPGLTLRLLHTHGFIVFFYLLVTVFFGDIFAYFAGRLFGKTKIFPLLSPKKTVAGAVGGLVGSMIFGSTILLCYTSTPPLVAPLLSLLIGIFAQFGDFFESLVKRISGKKDSSRLMPGHGGFLDRLDGVYFGSSVLYVIFLAGGHAYFV